MRSISALKIFLSSNRSIFIQTTLSVAAAPLLAAQIPLPAEAASFSQIYAFGDSLVDTGNALNLTGVPPEPYFEGRFSNGPIWTDYLAADLGIPQTSFGFGGALSSEFGLLLFNKAVVAPVPGLLTQVNQFAATAPAIDPEALYILWAGANDYLFAGVTDPSGPVANLTQAVNTLSGIGAENFLLVNLPDLGDLPLLDDPSFPPGAIAGLNTLSGLHNQALAEAVDVLDASDDITVDLLDINPLFKAAVAGAFGFSNGSDACTLTPDCLDNPAVQSSFLFWDEAHTTTAAYRIVADAALDKLHPAPATVPEPATGVALTLVGIWGVWQGRRQGA